MSLELALDEDNEIIGYEFVNLGKMMDVHQEGHGRQRGSGEGQGSLWPLQAEDGAVKYIDPRQGISRRMTNGSV